MFYLEVIVSTVLWVLAFVVVCVVPVLLRYRIIANLPEIRVIEDEKTRDHLTYLALEAFEPSLRGGLAVEALVLGIMGGAYGASSYFGASMVIQTTVLVCMAPVCAVIAVWISRRGLRRFIWRKLAERGGLVCLHCGYDLRGQTVCRCPECGKAFDPQRLTLRKGAFYAVDCWRNKD